MRRSNASSTILGVSSSGSTIAVASRTVHVGDALVFAQGGRMIELTVAAMGERRGPPAEARTLYVALDRGPPTDG